MRGIINFFTKLNYKKSAISIVVMIFVVGLFSSVDSLGSTYATAYGACYVCSNDSSIRFWWDAFSDIEELPDPSSKGCSGHWRERNAADGSACMYGEASQLFTAIFDANGGSTVTDVKQCWTDMGTTSCTVSNLPTSTRSGYDFKGWGTSSSCSSGNTSSLTLTTTSKTYYACWSPTETKTYTVAYNANGGSGAPANQTKMHGTNLTLSSTVPTRTGYTFLGWGTSSNATTVSYLPGSIYSYNANLSLYAVWVTEDDETETNHTVTYNANGGTGAPSADKKVKGVTLYLSKTIPTRSGYTFKGWGTYSADEVVDYLPGSAYTIDLDITLFAIWETKSSEDDLEDDTPSVTTYWVSFNPNGGSWSDGTPGVKTKTGLTGTNSFSSLGVSSSNIYRTGYTFGGWKNPSTGQVYTQNVDASDNGLELSAVWYSNSSGDESSTTYTVSYNANGGSGAPASQTKTHGTNLTLSNTVPTRTGHKFLGWATSSTATSAKYSAGGTYSANASVTLYAVWKPYSVYITFYAGGGSVTSKTNAGTWTVENDLIFLNSSELVAYGRYGGTISGDSLPNYNNPNWLNITKTGYNVVSGAEWKCKSGCTTSGKVFDQSKTYNVSDFCDTSKSDCRVQFEVNWKANTYNVTFNANGGSGAPASQTKTHGTNLTLSSTVPTRAGYKFLGWATSSTATTAAYNAGGTYSDNKAVTLYAVWQPYKIYITYYAGEGTVTSKTKAGTWTVKNDLIYLDSLEYVTNDTYGGTIESDEIVNYNNDEFLEVTKLGYTAVSGGEWKCKSGCSTNGKTYDQAKSYKVSDFCDISKSDCRVQLAVNWEPNSYKISYDLNGGIVSGNPTSAVFDTVVTINNPTKNVTIVVDSNGTGAIISESDSSISKFLGWTSTSIDTSTAYYGDTLWKNGSTKVLNTSFKNLTSVKDKTVKLVANWEPVSLTLPTITKEGYNCSWNTKSNGKGTSYNSGIIYNASNDSDSNIKLYAICRLPGDTDTNSDDEIKNPQTGGHLMFAALSIGLFALGYLIYGVKSGKINVK